MQSNKFTEEDIKILVKQFKMDFPTGKVNNEIIEVWQIKICVVFVKLKVMNFPR